MDAEGVNNINQDLYNSLCQVEDPDPTVVTIGLKGLMKCMEIAGKTTKFRRIWAPIVYKAQMKLLNSTDGEVVANLGQGLFKTLSLTEKDPNVYRHKETKYDETLQRVLFTMQMDTSGCPARKEWLIHLEKFIQIMGLANLRWLDRINQIMLNFVAPGQKQEWVLILKVVHAMIEATWMEPTMRSWVQITTKILSQLQDNAPVETEDKAEIYFNIQLCYELMGKCTNFSSIQSDLRFMIRMIEVHGQDQPNQVHLLAKFDECELRKFL
ncbi:uncharacterized protein LOC110858125 [Folsomia candida]|nr:uncharacterized protein LOC110858125 [Folsomia candida]